MNIAERIAKALLLLPLAEIAVFIAVAVAIGFWKAVLLSLATSVLGAVILKVAGRTHLRRFRSSLAEGVEMSAETAGQGVFLVLAGALLLVPGFITDVIGLLILLPPTRRAIGSVIGTSLSTVMKRHPGAADVVDLDPGEWQRHGDRTPPDREAREPPRIERHRRPN